MSGVDRQPDLVCLRVLGGFDLRPGAGPAAPASTAPAAPALGRKARGLLACLALSPDKAWSRERLMALLWGDRSEDQARASLRQALAEIRRVIGAEAVRTGDDAISLESALVTVDALDFDRLAAAGRWEEAAALYQGPLLDDHGVHDGGFEDWVRAERQRLQELAIDVLERVAAARSGEAAIAAVHRLLSLDPAREASHRLLMRLYVDTGQRTKALRQYEHCRDVLARELQTKPDAETERLHREIRNDAAPAPGVSSAARLSPDQLPPGAPSEVRASIAVLPFANMSGDPAQDYFSSGITEDIITELARFRFLFVMAGAGETADARAAGLRLGARYMVEGQVRRAGIHLAADRVRVTVHLIDTASGNHLWAERFDRAFDGIFAVQDEIAQRIVENVVPRVEAEGIDIARRKPPGDMRAYDYYLRAKALLQWPNGDADLRQGRDYCDRAIALAPSYARAHAEKAASYIVGFFLMESDDVEEWRRQALACAEHAVFLDPLDGFCHQKLAEAALLVGEYDRTRDHIARALAISPNDADILAISSYLYAHTGDAEGGLRQIELALEHNPTRPSWYHWVQGCVLYELGRCAEVARVLKLHSPANFDTLMLRAAALVELGQVEDARADIQTLLTLRPGATLDKARKHNEYFGSLERYMTSLRRAGLPE